MQERAEHVAEWVRLTEEKLSAQVGPKGPIGHRPQGGINAASREIGVTRQEAQRAVKIASMAPEAKEAAQLSLRYYAGLFRNRTPAPPPFSAMNSTPAASRAARIAARVRALGDV